MGASHVETKMRLPHELISFVKKTPIEVELKSEKDSDW